MVLPSARLESHTVEAVSKSPEAVIVSGPETPPATNRDEGTRSQTFAATARTESAKIAKSSSRSASLIFNAGAM